MESFLLVLDVSGTKISIMKDVLKKHPKSLFYELAFNAKFDKRKQQFFQMIQLSPDNFFVQRSPDMVYIMLQYLINDQLHVPKCVCSEQVLEEFKFWRLGMEVTCDNCADQYIGTEDFQMHVHTHPKRSGSATTWSKIMDKIWTFTEYPHSSHLALFFTITSIFFILLSVANITLASIPDLQFCPSDQFTNLTSTNINEDLSIVHWLPDNNVTDTQAAIFFAEDDFSKIACKGTTTFHVIDFICIAWFTFELLLRLIACPSMRTFFKLPLNVVDLISVLPFYVELILWLSNANHTYLRKARYVLFVFRILRVFRVFRILKLARYSPSLKSLGSTLYAAREELTMLLMFISITLFITSNFLYQAEKGEMDTMFTSIPATFWWSIVTLTTVGYGDVTPKSTIGKIFGGLTCVCGLMILAFPIAILVEKFMSQYKRQMKLHFVSLKVQKSLHIMRRFAKFERRRNNMTESEQ